VFPTLGDTWGLVVNEAMMFGLPVICSRYAGCASDLIINGKTGWLVNPIDLEDLVRILRRVWDARDEREVIAREGQALIASMNIQKMSEGFQRAVEYALYKRKSRSQDTALSLHKISDC
jgi:glycosyltransferase involved in cell wall biosynthesis